MTNFMESIKEDGNYQRFFHLFSYIYILSIQFSSGQASQVDSGKNNANSRNVQTYLLALVY